MKNLAKYYSWKKVIQSLILAFATHLLLSFLPIMVYENILVVIFYGDFNILTVILVILNIFLVLASFFSSAFL